jgi:hypothetical protein
MAVDDRTPPLADGTGMDAALSQHRHRVVHARERANLDPLWALACARRTMRTPARRSDAARSSSLIRGHEVSLPEDQM